MKVAGTWPRQSRVALVIVALVVIGSATAALADASGSDGGGTVTIIVSSSTSTPGSTTPGGGGGSSSGPVCSWQALSTEAVPGLAAGGDSPGTWYLETCPPGAAAFIGTEVVWVPTGTQTGTAAVVVSGADVAAQAEDSITLPSPVIELNPSSYSITNLPTWLWIDSSIWHSYSASASVSGISATATATPEYVTWTMGDGATVVCNGPGVPYQENAPAANQQTYCDHTYRRSSRGQASPDGNPNDGAFPVTATITWDVSWSASDGSGGSLSSLETSSTVRVRVEQVESVDSVH